MGVMFAAWEATIVPAKSESSDRRIARRVYAFIAVERMLGAIMLDGWENATVGGMIISCAGKPRLVRFSFLSNPSDQSDRLTFPVSALCNREDETAKSQKGQETDGRRQQCFGKYQPGFA